MNDQLIEWINEWSIDWMN